MNLITQGCPRHLSQPQCTCSNRHRVSIWERPHRWPKNSTAFAVARLRCPVSATRTFCLRVESGEKFVLKIANGLEDRALLEAQNAGLIHLGTRLSFCPRIVLALSGELMSQIESPSRVTNFVRLVTYLPGVPLAEVSWHSPELLRNLGQRLGQLDRELAAFDHPAVHRDFHWDLANGLRVIREYGTLILSLRLRELVYRCARGFQRSAGPLLPQLRRS